MTLEVVVLVALPDHHPNLFKNIKAGWEDAQGFAGEGMVGDASRRNE